MPDFLPQKLAREALMHAVPSLGAARAARLVRDATVAFAATGLELVDCAALFEAIDGARAAVASGEAEPRPSQCDPA